MQRHGDLVIDLTAATTNTRRDVGALYVTITSTAKPPSYISRHNKEAVRVLDIRAFLLDDNRNILDKLHREASV